MCIGIKEGSSHVSTALIVRKDFNYIIALYIFAISPYFM